MARTLWLIPIGAVAGSAAAWAIAHFGGDEPVSATAIGIVEPDAAAPGAAPSIPAPGAFAASRSAHAEAAGIVDGFELEQAIGRVAREPRSAGRDARLDALVVQLAALDPRAAAELVERLQLDTELLGKVFQAWADAAPEQALAEVRGLFPPAKQRAVALAMLEVFGANEAGIAKIEEIFPPAEAMSFRIDAIGRLAELDFDAATAAAEKIEVSATQTIAQQRIAVVMAAIDPVRGLEYANGRIPIPIQRQRYMDRLLDNWAKLDPDGMFAYMEKADLTQMTVSASSFRALATTSPEKLLGLAEKFAPAQRVQAQRAALEVLTALDPVTAYNRVSTLPASTDRDNFINTVAQRYAAQSPDAAVAWVTTLEPRSSIAFNAVMAAVAQRNPLRVADAVIAEITNPSANTAGMPTLAALLTPALQARSPDIALVADKLAGHDDPRVRMQLRQLVTLWPQADPEGAMAWAMRNPASLTPESAPQIAERLASQNPDLARQSLQRLPAELRGPWIQGTAAGMAPGDLDGALAWLETFRNDPVYRAAVDSALNAAASSDPEAVARQLERFPESRQRIAPMLAMAWAARDPEAAANWLTRSVDFSEPQPTGPQLSSVAGIIVSQWAARDAAAAERWVLSLPRGAARDEGLTGLLQRGASRGNVDARLLDQYSSPEAQGRGVLSTVSSLARSNPDLARQLIDRHITDPTQRTQAERVLETAGRLPAGLPAGALPGVPNNILIRGTNGRCLQVTNGVAMEIAC